MIVIDVLVDCLKKILGSQPLVIVTLAIEIEPGGNLVTIGVARKVIYATVIDICLQTVFLSFGNDASA